MSAPDAIGDLAAPARYTNQARETCDRQRDMVPDAHYVSHCRLTARKYRDRAGLKDPTPIELAKADWYDQMADHVEFGVAPDPRHRRPDFQPYERQIPDDGVMRLRSVLDHGYVRVCDWSGLDSTIIEAARMSTQKGFRGWGTPDEPGDERLLRYLYTHKHSTPFEFPTLTIEVQAPIFVFREWHRHRTQTYSEASARYAPLPELDYVPTVERLMYTGGANKQAGAAAGSQALDAHTAEAFRELLIEHYAAADVLYREALANGIPKELARLVLPMGRYSKMRAATDLRNWLGFMALRLDVNAQWEIRQYAEIVSDIVHELWPRTWALFDEARRG